MGAGSRRGRVCLSSHAADAALLWTHDSSAADAAAEFHRPHGDRAEGDGGTGEG